MFAEVHGSDGIVRFCWESDPSRLFLLCKSSMLSVVRAFSCVSSSTLSSYLKFAEASPTEHAEKKDHDLSSMEKGEEA